MIHNPPTLYPEAPGHVAVWPKFELHRVSHEISLVTHVENVDIVLVKSLLLLIVPFIEKFEVVPGETVSQLIAIL